MVLVADDEGVIRELLERHLTAIGCRVLTAETGEKALVAAIRGEKPDLVLLDIRMPGMGGIKCLSRLKLHYRDLHVIMLTAVEDMRVAQLAMTNGAMDYLTKPVDLTVISKVVRTVLNPRLSE